jgi:phospholipid/cholesterol/gamma-HCH transport system substrate-binding protein
MRGKLRGLGGPFVKLVIFGLVTVLASYVLLSTITNAGFGDQTTYRAQFSDVAGLVDGDEVRIAGVRVGQVTGIELADQKEEPTAQVSFEVDSDVPLPTSVHATIRYRNLVGQRYISLTEGDGSGGQHLAANALIPMAQTTPALDLTTLFGGFRPLLQALSPEDVNRVSYEIIQVFQGEGGTVESLLSHVASLTSSLADKDQVIGSVIENLTTVMDTVAQRDQQLSDLIVSLQQFVTGLAQDKDAIFDSLQTIDQLAQTTSGFLDDARPPLAADIQHLGDLAGNVAANGDQLEQFLRLAPTKIDLITRTAINGSWFNFFMCSYNGTVVLPATGLVPDPVTGVLPTPPPSSETTFTVPPTKSGAEGCG